VSEKYETELLF